MNLLFRLHHSKKKLLIKTFPLHIPEIIIRTINDVSFEIRKGEIIALVGPNGAGKSTLVRLLCRLYDPDSGIVRYDDSDIRNFNPEEYRKHFSVVFQDFMLYNLTAERISVWVILKTDNPDERIINQPQHAGVHDLIINLPKGYDTVIGTLFDDSRELSWGEWQKIALARSLFQGCPCSYP